MGRSLLNVENMLGNLFNADESFLCKEVVDITHEKLRSNRKLLKLPSYLYPTVNFNHERSRIRRQNPAHAAAVC